MKKSAKENDKVLEELRKLKRENRRLKSKLLSYENVDKPNSGKTSLSFDIPSFFKNSGSASRQDLHLWSIANPSLIKLIDWKKFQELQDSLSKAYNISSIVCDINGRSLTKLSHYILYPGKKKTAGNKKSLGFLNTLKNRGAEAKPYWAYYEETNLWNVLVPLNDEGEILGYWLSAFPGSGNTKKGKTGANKHNTPPGEFKKFVSILEGIGSSFVDMRNRKKIDEELKLLAYMVKSVSEVITITDFNDNLIFVNDAFISEYGYSREEVIGKNVSMLRPPETPKEILDSLGIKNY
ncbi:MAG TPA: PAS domain S-box protein [Ignavibacteriales bacterium]|nr:PAS domain S-box protein [Ignavibacteriales bacterium]